MAASPSNYMRSRAVFAGVLAAWCLVVAGLLTFKDCQVMLVGAAVRCLVVQLVIEKASLAFAQQTLARSSWRASWVKEL